MHGPPEMMSQRSRSGMTLFEKLRPRSSGLIKHILVLPALALRQWAWEKKTYKTHIGELAR